MLTDLAKLDQIIYDATGITPTLVRPPYGAVNRTVKYETGRAMITWTVDTKDWMYRDAASLIEYIQNYGDLDGEVVLMHSIHSSTAEAMATIVPWLIEQGYQLVTVSELMAYYYGELLEPNKFYSQNYFARHERTEYPLELPAEPMQTQIPEYTTVPVVPMIPEETPEVPPADPVPDTPPADPVPDTPPAEDIQPQDPVDPNQPPAEPPAEDPAPDTPGESEPPSVPDESEDPTAEPPSTETTPPDDSSSDVPPEDESSDQSEDTPPDELP